MKRCRECGSTKDYSEYYKHKQMKDGHLNKCKDCVKGRVSKHRVDNIDSIQEYDRNRPNHVERLEETKARYKNKREEGDPDWLRKDRVRSLSYRENNPVKYKAHCAVNNAIRDGLLEKPICCSVCPETVGIQGHHWSYEEKHWLDVVWLCPSCHAKEHKRLNEISRNK